MPWLRIPGNLTPAPSAMTKMLILWEQNCGNSVSSRMGISQLQCWGQVSHRITTETIQREVWTGHGDAGSAGVK